MASKAVRLVLACLICAVIVAVLVVVIQHFQRR